MVDRSLVVEWVRTVTGVAEIEADMHCFEQDCRKLATALSL
jgi:hypothetical protein